MADILISSWASGFPGCPTAIVRAGNVIGGGDISTDRLMPDLIRAFKASDAVNLRYPDADRPCQHVLDCFSGYLALLEALPNGRGEGVWNFGPDERALRTVRETAELAIALWPGASSWAATRKQYANKADLLTLNSDRAREKLGWRDMLVLEQSVGWTVE